MKFFSILSTCIYINTHYTFSIPVGLKVFSGTLTWKLIHLPLEVCVSYQANEIHVSLSIIFFIFKLVSKEKGKSIRRLSHEAGIAESTSQDGKLIESPNNLLKASFTFSIACASSNHKAFSCIVACFSETSSVCFIIAT